MVFKEDKLEQYQRGAILSIRIRSPVIKKEGLQINRQTLSAADWLTLWGNV